MRIIHTRLMVHSYTMKKFIEIARLGDEKASAELCSKIVERFLSLVKRKIKVSRS